MTIIRPTYLAAALMLIAFEAATMAQTITIGANGSNTTDATNYSGAVSLVKVGSNIVSLTGSNTYTGGTTVSNGVLQAGANGAFSTNSTFTLNGGTIDLNATTQSIHMVQMLSGTNTQTNGSLTTLRPFFEAIMLAPNAGDSGTYNLQGGYLGTTNLGNIQVGYRGTGVFNQSGGTNNVSGYFVIGRFSPGGNGTYNLTGGLAQQSSANRVSLIGEDGTGVMNVSGTGVYSNAGKIIIAASANANGTLSISDGGVVIAPGIDFGAGTGRVIFDRSDAYSAIIPMNGQGSVIKNGSGTVTFTVNNGYTRGTTVNQGALIVKGLANNANNTVTVNNGGTFVFDVNNTFGNHSANVITPIVINGGTVQNNTNLFNALGLITMNGGSLKSVGMVNGYSFALKADVTVNSNSTISGPGITLGSAAITGTAFNVAGGATLTVDSAFTNGPSPTWPRSQASYLTKAGGGTMLLNGTNTYTGDTTISDGVLWVNGSGLLNNGNYDGNISIATNGRLVIGTTANQSLGGIISGSGSLMKTNSGTLTITGPDNSYTGTTTVGGGTLVLTGTHTGGDRYTVQTNATLMGEGRTTSAVTVDSGGNITPGNGGLGELTIGSLTLKGTLNIFLDGDNTSLLTVIGNASLNGGSVNFTTNNLTNDVYVFLSASGVLSGTFATNNTPSGYGLVYDTNDGVAFLKKSSVTNVVEAIFNGPNAVIGNGATNFNVYVYNGSSSTTITNFTASGMITNGSVTIGSVSTNNIAPTNGVELPSLTFSNSGSSFGTNTGAFNYTLNGASNQATFEVVVYNHASNVVTGTNLSFGPVHRGAATASSTNSVTVSNSTNGFRIALGVTNNNTNSYLSIDTAGGLAQGDSADLFGQLDPSKVALGYFTNTVQLISYDDSDLSGASTNVGTTSVTITGYVYSGQGVWTNSGTGNWADFANWQVDGGTPGLDGALSVADTATFGTNGSGSVTLNTNASLLSVTFSNAASSYTVGGTGTLTLASYGGTNASVSTLAGSHTITAPVEFASAVILSNSIGTGLTISGSITGNGSLVKSGAGTTTLTGSNSFSGGTVIDAGRLVAMDANALGSGNVTINSGGTLAPGAGPSLKIGGDMTVNSGTYQWTLYTNANTQPGTNFTAPVQLTGKLQVAEDSPFAMFFTNVTSSDPFWDTLDARKTWRVMESVGNNHSLVDGLSFKVAWATVPGNQTNGFDLADFFFTLDEENGHLDLNYLKTASDLVATNVANGGTTISSGTNGYATVSYETNGRLQVDALAELIITDPVVMSNNSTTTINGSFVAPGGVTVQVGSTIGGSGTIDAEIVNSGTFAPAVTNRSLTINNDLTFKSGSAFLWTLYNNTTNGPGTNFTAPVQLNAKMTVETNSRFTMLFTSDVNSADSFWKAEATNSWTVMTGESVDLQEGTMFKPDWAPGSQTNGFNLKNFYFTVTNNSLVLNFMPGLIVFPGEDEFDPGVNEYPWVQYQPGGELDIPVGVNLLIENAVTMNNNSTTIVNGQYTSTNGFTLANGSLLGGSGTLNGNLVSSGTVSPGNSPGTLTIAGNYTQTSAGAILFQAASLSSFDRIVVTGTASLAGALNAVGFGGYALAPGTSFQFLTATGGITGTFDTITLDNPTLRGRFLVSGANNSLGTLLIAPLTYTQMATTPNDASVAKALDTFIAATSGDKLTVSTALDSLTASQYAQAFAAIAPTLYQSLSTMAFNAANAQYNDLVQQMFGLRVAGTGFSMSGLGDNIAILEGQGDKGVLDSKKDILRPGEDNHWGMFVDGNGIFAQANSGNMLQNFNAQSGGLIAGLTYKWSPAVATGIYSGYQGTYAKYSGTYSGSTVINNAVRFGLLATYGDPSGRGFYGDALIGGSYNNYSVTRAITFPGMNRTANSTPGAGELDSMIAAGYNFRKGNWAFGPVSSLQYTYFGMNSFNETGAQSLDYQGLNWNTASMIYNLGANCAYNWKATRNLTVVPQVNLAWQHEFMQNPYSINGNLSGTPVVNTSAAPLRDTLYTGVGVTLEYKKRWNTAFFYNAAAGNSDLVSQNIFWSLGCKF